MEQADEVTSQQWALHGSEQQFQLLVESVQEYAIYMLDPGGHVVSWNSGAERIKGYQASEVLGQHFSLFYTEEDVAGNKPQQELDIAVKRGHAEVRGWRLRKNGSQFLAHVVITPIVDNAGTLLGFAKVTRDISGHQAAEQRFQQVVESAPSAMVMINTQGTIEMVNTQTERIFGYDRDDLLGKRVEILLPDRFRQHHPHLREAFFANPKSRPMGAGRDLYGRRQDGSEFPIEIGLNPIETDEGTKVLSVIIDLSARKRQEERLLQVVESAPSAMVMINAQGTIEMVNAQAERVFGYERNELINQPVEMLVPQRFVSMHPTARSAFFNSPLARPMGKGRDLYARRKDGSEFPVEIGLNPIETDEGTKVLSAIVDISDRKVKEQKIEAALEEKNILLGEVHHRVKNNLQIVHSLLDLQSARISDPVALEMLRDSQNRIRSMALIHQSLYLSNDFARVNIGHVLEALVPTLMESYSVDHSRIASDLVLGDILLSINQAIPCGLIINELISNALKHAFPDQRSGTIRIELTGLDDDSVLLAVSDDGAGIAPEYDLGNTDTLGLQLIHLLADQLGATLSINRAHPTRFELRFTRKE